MFNTESEPQRKLRIWGNSDVSTYVYHWLCNKHTTLMWDIDGGEDFGGGGGGRNMRELCTFSSILL